MFTAVCHHEANKPQKYIWLVLRPGMNSCITVTAQAARWGLCPKTHGIDENASHFIK